MTFILLSSQAEIFADLIFVRQSTPCSGGVITTPLIGLSGLAKDISELLFICTDHVILNHLKH